MVSVPGVKLVRWGASERVCVRLPVRKNEIEQKMNMKEKGGKYLGLRKISQLEMRGRLVAAPGI